MKKMILALILHFSLLPHLLCADPYHEEIYKYLQTQLISELNHLAHPSLSVRIGHDNLKVDTFRYATVWLLYVYQDEKLIDVLHLPTVIHEDLFRTMAHNSNAFLAEIKKVMMDRFDVYLQDHHEHRNMKANKEESRTRSYFEDLDPSSELVKLGLKRSKDYGGFHQNLDAVAGYFANWIEVNTKFKNVKYIKSVPVNDFDLGQIQQKDLMAKIIRAERVLFKMDGIIVNLILPFGNTADAWVSNDTMMDAISYSLFSGMEDRIKGQDFFWHDMGFGDVEMNSKNAAESSQVSQQGSVLGSIQDKYNGVQPPKTNSSAQETKSCAHSFDPILKSHLYKKYNIGPDHFKNAPNN